MTRQRRRFTALQKAEAIALGQKEGLTILEVSKRLGIHATCLGSGSKLEARSIKMVAVALVSSTRAFEASIM